jgi:hypothetical protein
MYALKREAGLSMMGKKKTKNGLGKRIFGFFFAILSIFMSMMPVMLPTTVYADPTEGETTNEETTDEEATSGETTDSDATATVSTGDGCQSSLGAIGWLVCPTTGKIAEAVDWLYDRIEGILAINPISSEDGSPIYKIWKYCRGLTNIVFIIFLLVVIYSQITGVGISNYGIKKALPKLIVTAILVNLSFLICSLAVDVSNIVGNSLRGLFDTVASSAVSADSGMTAETKMMNAEMFSAIAGGTALTIGAVAIAVPRGVIWMLIPVVLGALVAVVTGLITIALRQAVVALLIMISPLAIVAYILPNTEHLFKKWKQLLTQMLAFYPMFSLLFGASSLAGFAIIMSASDGFGVLLGIAVQIFPLFFSWKLMQMSGTFLGNINAKMRQIAAPSLAKNRAWADSRRMHTKQRFLASERPVTPSLRLMQFMSDRKIAREAETDTNAELAKARGMAYRARRHYDKNGLPSKRGRELYEGQARALEYQQIVERDKNNMDNGLSVLAGGRDVAGATRRRLEALDNRMVAASDKLKFEQARGEKISADNAEGFYKRTEAAINWHMDQEKGYETGVLEDGQTVTIPRKDYKFHFDPNSSEAATAATRYATMSEVMNGNAVDVQFAAANAAHGYDMQKKIIETKMGKYFDMTPPSKDLEYRLTEITKSANAVAQIDTIISGLRVMSKRGDTDEVRRQVENVLNSGEGIQLGTHASQSLASFLMFEVKDSDPFLRRFGKYINLETAQVYNKNKRQNARLSLEEYVTGEYEDWDAETHERVVRKSKKGMVTLLEGTQLDGLERTAYNNVDEMLKNAYTTNGELDVHKYLGKRTELEKAIEPAFISASLKYPSGSEQLKSAVSFLTGYDGDVPKWENQENPLYGSAEAEAYFRQRTVDYLKNQTPTQIFGLRSDYHGALLEHLSKEYEETDTTGWSEEAIEERNEYMAELADIQTRYGDLPPEEAQNRRNADRQALKDKMAGAEFRQILESKGMLGQIYNTRRSGAANGAKHWVRGWLNLDDEVKVNKYLGRLKSRQRDETAEQQHEEPGVEGGGFNDTDRAYLRARVEQLRISLNGMDGESFYRESTELIRNELHGMSDTILRKYEDFYRSFNGGADGQTLEEELVRLIEDSENYS